MTTTSRRRARARSLAAVSFPCLLALGVGACGQGDDPGTAPPSTPGAASVVRVVDGDTLVVRIGGREERVRMIGIDTPETVDEDRPVECFGPEASARTTALLPPGTVVRLERDVEARDRYDRLLAYVTREADGALINEVLVAEGMAEAFPYPPNTARQADLEAAEAEARAARRGQWGACTGGATPPGSR